jgi:hypothetical protein
MIDRSTEPRHVPAEAFRPIISQAMLPEREARRKEQEKAGKMERIVKELAGITRHETQTHENTRTIEKLIGEAREVLEEETDNE